MNKGEVLGQKPENAISGVGGAMDKYIRPLADPDDVACAEQHKRLCASPREWVASIAPSLACASWVGCQYKDAGLDAWVQEVRAILLNPFALAEVGGEFLVGYAGDSGAEV